MIGKARTSLSSVRYASDSPAVVGSRPAGWSVWQGHDITVHPIGIVDLNTSFIVIMQCQILPWTNAAVAGDRNTRNSSVGGGMSRHTRVSIRMLQEFQQCLAFDTIFI